MAGTTYNPDIMVNLILIKQKLRANVSPEVLADGLAGYLQDDHRRVQLPESFNG